MGIMRCVEILPTAENGRKERAVLHPVGAQLRRLFQRFKDGINHSHMTIRRVAETEALEEQFTKRLNDYNEARPMERSDRGRFLPSGKKASS